MSGKTLDFGSPAPDRAVAARKLEALAQRLRACGNVLVAYSGGVDSTLLAHVAWRVLGEQALFVTAVSPSFSAHERQLARDHAQQLGFGARHFLVETNELSDPDYGANDALRCYYCRRRIMACLRQKADEHGIDAIVLGVTADDVNDYRPGERAAAEAGARFPLREVGLNKPEIRLLSFERDLPTWQAPSTPCLATRLAYGVAITPERLRVVEEGEAFLRELGLRDFRLRHHGTLARIECRSQDLERVMQHRQAIADRLRALGFSWVSLDLAGYRQGSMNAVLDQESV